MNVTIRKATETDIAKLKNNPTWRCEVSEFDWHYDSEEICWLTEGEVVVTYERFEAVFAKLLDSEDII